MLPQTKPAYESGTDVECDNQAGDRESILHGRPRDYIACEGPTNPYRTPDFIFLGDDLSGRQRSSCPVLPEDQGGRQTTLMNYRAS